MSILDNCKHYHSDVWGLILGVRARRKSGELQTDSAQIEALEVLVAITGELHKSKTRELAEIARHLNNIEVPEYGCFSCGWVGSAPGMERCAKCELPFPAPVDGEDVPCECGSVDMEHDCPVCESTYGFRSLGMDGEACSVEDLVMYALYLERELKAAKAKIEAEARKDGDA